MKSFSLGNIIQVAANPGVLAGNIFLAIEVRHARAATELQTIESITGGWVL